MSTTFLAFAEFSHLLRLNFQCFATFSPIRGIYFLLLIHSSQMCQNFCYIFGDSSSTLGFVAGPLIVLICMRNVLNFTDSSIVFFVVVLSTRSGQIRLP